MRQNIGLLFLTLGSILLSIGIFRTHLVRFINFHDWKNVPWELRAYLRLRGIKDRDAYLKWLVHSQEKDRYPSGETGELPLSQRIDLDLPIVAIILMVIGFFLCFGYSALWRFLSSIF